MDSFLKFLEDDCPGDEAHSGFGDPKPLLERCGMCAAIYEAHQKAVAQATGELRETITRLNRRCQEAESAARVKVEEVQKAGPSLGRALAGWAAADYRRKYEEAQKEIEAFKKTSQAESFLEAARFLETMPSWTDPGEFTKGWDAAAGALKERAEFLKEGATP